MLVQATQIIFLRSITWVFSVQNHTVDDCQLGPKKCEVFITKPISNLRGGAFLRINDWTLHLDGHLNPTPKHGEKHQGSTSDIGTTISTLKHKNYHPIFSRYRTYSGYAAKVSTKCLVIKFWIWLMKISSSEMPFTPGTLAEYDMILSLTQGAINSQFNVLFNTVNPANTDENLISNTMKLGYMKYDDKTQTMKASKQGITATIESPTVDLNNVGSSATLYRSVRIVIKMDKGTLSYWDEGDLETLSVDGYTVSWVTEIGQRNIEDIEEEVMVHPDAKAALQEVPHDDYLISSLFCLFESTRVANTFQLVDKDGNKARDDSQVAAFLNSLIVTYSNLDPMKYPYVLGYGVSQKTPMPMTGTPAFCPAKFYFSTTPNSSTDDEASINFLLINGDAHNDSLVDPTQNPAAGVLPSPLTTVTRSENLSSDGIFAVSDNMFFNYWLEPTIFDTFSFSTSFFENLGIDSMSVNETVTRNQDSPPGASKSSNWSSDWIDTGNVWTGKGRRMYSGYSTMNLTYTSVLQNQPSGTISANATRSVDVNVVGCVYNQVSFNMATLVAWVDEGYVSSTTNWDFLLSISADSDGTWTVEKTTWNVPGTTTYSSTVDETLLSVLSGFSDTDKILAYLSDIDESTFDGISDALKSISTNFIMPAGDVYSFAGLDCDGDGNLYSHIKYNAAS